MPVVSEHIAKSDRGVLPKSRFGNISASLGSNLYKEVAALSVS
nr:hypothetical protein [Microseira wollei]